MTTYSSVLAYRVLFIPIFVNTGISCVVFVSFWTMEKVILVSTQGLLPPLPQSQIACWKHGSLCGSSIFLCLLCCHNQKGFGDASVNSYCTSVCVFHLLRNVTLQSCYLKLLRFLAPKLSLCGVFSSLMILDLPAQSQRFSAALSSTLESGKFSFSQFYKKQTNK